MPLLVTINKKYILIRGWKYFAYWWILKVYAKLLFCLLKKMIFFKSNILHTEEFVFLQRLYFAHCGINAFAKKIFCIRRMYFCGKGRLTNGNLHLNLKSKRLSNSMSVCCKGSNKFGHLVLVWSKSVEISISVKESSMEDAIFSLCDVITTLLNMQKLKFSAKLFSCFLVAWFLFPKNTIMFTERLHSDNKCYYLFIF